MVKVCAVAAQPGHTKELRPIQLERGLRIVDSPGVIFEDDDSIQGQEESSVLLRNVIKPEDVDEPISVGGCTYSPSPLRVFISGLSPVEEILARTQTERLMKIYDLPMFLSTFGFLTMLALSTGRLKVRLLFSPPKFKKSFFSLQGGIPDILSAARHTLIDWNHQKIPFFSEPPTLHAAHIPSTFPVVAGKLH